MQLFELYSLRDLKADAFGPPIHAVSRGGMIRSLVSATRQPNSVLADFPQDFDLYLLGTFDDAEGVFGGKKSLVGNVKMLLEVANAKPEISVSKGGA